MKRNEKPAYESPEIFEFDAMVENGFALSRLDAPDYDPDRSFGF